MATEACLICGAPLFYLEQGAEMECASCHKRFISNASCENGHFICDVCHGELGIQAIRDLCQRETEMDPIRLAQRMMALPAVHLHGPEHHVLVGSALLTAYHNAGGRLDKAAALEEMARRGREVPGGACGFWGCCGAAISAGIYWSIATDTTPLDQKNWGLANRLVAACLEEIGGVGGPRCCKRDSFLAIQTAVIFTKEHLGVAMAVPQRVQCGYFSQNAECIQAGCPFYSKEELR
ncbi:MAG: SAM-dependent methyltransferase [Bacillota bacterium]|nr:MAG: SAM-dependent methyltransferase [Bacillota bacterium]